VLGCTVEEAGHVVLSGHEEAAPGKDSAMVLLDPPLRLVREPVAQKLLAVRLEDPRARLGQRELSGLHAPRMGSLGEAIVGPVQEEVGEIHRLQDDALGGIEIPNPLHEEGVEPREEVARDDDAGAAPRVARAGERREEAHKSGEAVDEVIERARGR